MYRSGKKKQRGQRRKLKVMFRYIDKFTPFAEIDEKYEHFHVPSTMFIVNKQTLGRIKTDFCRKWLDITKLFIEQKPTDLQFCKVVAVLSVSNYWSSQIIIFYDECYYNSFWTRTGPEQFWTPIRDQKHSFSKERNVSTLLQETGYHELIIDGDKVFKDELWFYGDLPI